MSEEKRNINDLIHYIANQLAIARCVLEIHLDALEKTTVVSPAQKEDLFKVLESVERISAAITLHQQSRSMEAA